MASHEAVFIEPVRKLNASLSDILDVDAHPERDPAEALAQLRAVMETFHEETVTWL